MLHFVYGCPGGGKSGYLTEQITKRTALGKKIILIVPERFSVSAEARLYAACEDTCKINLEVLSFRRLANRVFREYGGLCYNYAGKGCRTLMMWRALSGIKNDLETCVQLELSNADAVSAILESITALKRTALNPDMLMEAAMNGKVKERVGLSSKLSDLSHIWTEYDRLLHEKYDDPEEDLARLCEVLEKHNFFSDKEVYMDATMALSGQEIAVLRRILLQTPHLTVTIPMLPEDDREMLEKVRWFRDTVYNLAYNEGIEVRRDAVLDIPVKKSAPELRHLEKQLFGMEKQFEGSCEAIALNRFASPYEESKAIAARILKDVMAGGRYKDHAVVVRNTEDYKGIVDSVFDANGIPYLFAGSVSFAGRPAGRMILAALRLFKYNFRLDDLFSYIGTGLSGLTDGESFILEDYANLWQIEGKRWLKEQPFMMNPVGHTAERTDASFEKLAEINRIKEKLIAPLRAFGEDLSASKTGREFATALFDFLLSIGLEERLSLLEQAANEAGKGREAQFHAQTFQTICDLLDELVYAMGDCPCTTDEFLLMLEVLMKETELGAIPEGKDRVLISDAFNLSPIGVRVLHLPGMNEGVFPADPFSGGMFAEKELETLRTVGIDLPGGGERAVLDEQHLAYAALTLPYEKLYISCYEKNLKGVPGKPSMVYETIKSVFGENVENKEEDLLYGYAVCLEKALETGRGVVHQALYDYFEEKSRSLIDNALRAPLITVADSLSPAVVAELYPSKALKLSQSRLESFVNCPFSYTCSYVLKLQQQMKEDTGENEIGTVMHAVLERLIKDEIEKGRQFKEMTDREIEEAVCKITEDLRLRMLGEGEESESTIQLLRRMKDGATILSKNLRDEFAVGSFEPLFCELPFGRKTGGETISLPAITTIGSYPVTVNGIADRVDVYRGENGVFYLRVVDYKTGKKQFKPDRIEDGLNLQMLIYLRTLIACSDPAFLKVLGAEKGSRLLPAGVEYYIASNPTVLAEQAFDEEMLKHTLRREIKRSGWISSDEEVKKALGQDCDFLPNNKDFLVSGEQLDETLKRLDDLLSGFACRIRMGEAGATPRKKSGGFNGCTYCPMLPICRNKISSSQHNEN